MERPFGLGLRSQLMFALIIAFGAAFVLLSVVTARLDESENAEERRHRADSLVQALAAGAGSLGEGFGSESINQMVAEGLVNGVEIQSEDGQAQRWGRTVGVPDAVARTSGGADLRVWVPVGGRGSQAKPTSRSWGKRDSSLPMPPDSCFPVVGAQIQASTYSSASTFALSSRRSSFSTNKRGTSSPT